MVHDIRNICSCRRGRARADERAITSTPTVGLRIDPGTAQVMLTSFITMRNHPAAFTKDRG